MGSITRSFANNITTAGKFDGTKLTGDIPEANLSANAPAFDDNKIVNDLSTLSLRVHTQENLAASSTNSQYVDVFQDSTGIANLSGSSRDSSGEYVSTSSTSTVAADAGGTLTDITASNTNWSSGSTNDNYGDGNDIGIDGSWDYSYWSTSALLTGDCRHEVNGTTLSVATNETAGTSNRLEFGVTNQQGGTSDGSGGNSQTNTNLTDSTSCTHSNTAPFIFASTGGYGRKIMLRKNNSGTTTNIATITTPYTWSTGSQLSFARKDSTLYFMIDGSIVHTFDSSDFNYSGDMYFTYGFGQASSQNWLDCKYRSNLSAVKGIQSTSFNATGNFESNAISLADSSSINKAGAVITYQDQAGTNALNTDIILQISADNGSNYTTATLTALPDFSSGIKCAKVNDLSIGTPGSQLKYKILFANQSNGVKEARIRGVSLNY